MSPLDCATSLCIKWQSLSRKDIKKSAYRKVRAALIIFNAVVDSLSWAMICSGIMDLAHYFIFWSKDMTSCQQRLHLNTAVDRSTAHRLHMMGLPVEPLKVEGLLTILTFSGIELDTIRRELRLPLAKLSRLNSVLRKDGI